MDPLKRLFREAPRMVAGEELWNRIERSRATAPVISSLDNGRTRRRVLRPLLIGGALASALALLLVTLPVKQEAVEQEKWAVLYSELLSENEHAWEETSSLGGELTSTLVAWIDHNKGEQQ